MSACSLQFVYDGWSGYQLSLRKAIEPRTSVELAWRPKEDLPSVGEIAAHIGWGRIIWFSRMHAPGSLELLSRHLPHRTEDGKWKDPELTVNLTWLLDLLDSSWSMVERTLSEWTVDDLDAVYRHVYQDKAYAVSRQWTIWRILSHDIHHGGQISELLYLQGIEIVELGYLGGHLSEPAAWQGEAPPN